MKRSLIKLSADAGESFTRRFIFWPKRFSGKANLVDIPKLFGVNPAK